MAKRDPIDLGTAKADILRLASAIVLKLAGDDEPPDAPEGCGVAAGDPAQDQRDASRMTIALAWARAREERDKAFRSHLFVDPAWSMLLDLYIHHCRERPVCTTSLCIASNVPEATARRWITSLEDEGLIRRRPNPADGRVIYIELTEAAIRKMEDALDGAASSDRSLGLGRLRILK